MQEKKASPSGSEPRHGDAPEPPKYRSGDNGLASSLDRGKPHSPLKRITLAPILSPPSAHPSPTSSLLRSAVAADLASAPQRAIVNPSLITPPPPIGRGLPPASVGVRTGASPVPTVPAHYVALASQRIIMDVRSITKSLPLGRERIEILRGISFQIRSGEFVALVGPSGSGKSTLLGIIAGLDNPTSGQVLIDGVDIARLSEEELAKVRNLQIGMVFQAFNLIPTLTALENVESPLQVGKRKGSHSTRAKELLTLVGLAHRLHYRPRQLSGGEQQRVAIARALATDPPIVIADEPTGNLDARNGDNILQLIDDLCARTGKTFVIATHDPKVARHASRAIRLVDGQVARLDTTGGRITQ